MERVYKAREKGKEDNKPDNQEPVDDLSSILNSVTTGFEDDLDDYDI